jgi:hypothetical protein
MYITMGLTLFELVRRLSSRKKEEASFLENLTITFDNSYTALHNGTSLIFCSHLPCNSKYLLFELIQFTQFYPHSPLTKEKQFFPTKPYEWCRCRTNQDQRGKNLPFLTSAHSDYLIGVLVCRFLSRRFF